MKQIDGLATEFMTHMKNSKENISEEDKKHKMKVITEFFNKVKEFGDDKVNKISFLEILVLDLVQNLPFGN